MPTEEEIRAHNTQTLLNPEKVHLNFIKMTTQTDEFASAQVVDPHTQSILEALLKPIQAARTQF